MSQLSRKIAAAVDQNPGPGPLTVDDDPRRLTLDLTSASPVGVAFNTLDFVAGDGLVRSTDDLKRWGRPPGRPVDLPDGTARRP